MTRYIDVSLGIGPGLLTWPGDPGIEIVPTARLDRGDPANVSELRFGSHTGTHVDPPFHFIDGAATVDHLSLGALIGDAVVADLRGFEGAIGPGELEALGLSPRARRVLLKTDNSEIWRANRPVFPERYVSLSPEGAAWMVERGIALVGIDFLSIEEARAPGHPTHRTLLEAGVVILEGLDLFVPEPGAYQLMCLPLKITDGDGAPARAVLATKRRLGHRDQKRRHRRRAGP